MTDSGELVSTAALADPVNSKSVRAHGGPPVITDGPFIEAKEQFGGYLIVDWRFAPQVLGALVRRYGQFDACEDAVQEALIDAEAQWPRDGAPENPRGWLLAVASRRLIDDWRSESARRRREETLATLEPTGEGQAPTPDEAPPEDRDDTLTLLFLCCHPELTPPSQIALTLRAVGGLSTDEIARAFLVPEATMAQRIGRAKQRIKATGSEFAMPTKSEREERLRAVLPDHGEVTGLLALMLLTDARRETRTTPDGALVPLDGPAAGLELLATLDGDGRLADHHRLAAVRAHLLEQAGGRDAVRAQYREAARRTTSMPEQRYLDGRAAAITNAEPQQQ